MGQASKLQKWLFAITAFSLFAGLLLSIVSWLRLCSGACAESHNWRFFGGPIENLGLLFFIPANILFWLSWRNVWLFSLVGLMLFGALGAEIHFILVQKYKIGAWCPVCLSIAASVGLAALCYCIKYILELTQKRGSLMTQIWKGFAGLSVCVLGFLISLLGTAQFDQLAAAEATLKESLMFGNKESPIEVYIFTDWACPACRVLEPALGQAAPKIMKKARLTFVDHAIHTATLNYSPYNVSFMIRNKTDYLKLRDALTHLSLKTSSPTEAQVEKIAEGLGTKYESLNFSDIALSQKYFKELGRQFGVKQTPTAILVNLKTRKGKKLIGADQITESNVERAISSLSTDKS
jgi:hypothetical protein